MSPSVLFRDRNEAGELLAQAIAAELDQLRSSGVWVQPIVYALPRGGLPVAAPVARLLGCPLDIVIAKKITLPEEPELAMGAVTADGQVLWSRQKLLSQSHPRMQQALHQAQERAQAQYNQFASSRPHASPQGAIAILIDDGIATGMTMAVATKAIKAQKPLQIWIAAPVAPPMLTQFLGQWSDRAIVLSTPHPFLNVSRFYTEFPQVELEEALTYLQFTG